MSEHQTSSPSNTRSSWKVRSAGAVLALTAAATVGGIAAAAPASAATIGQVAVNVQGFPANAWSATWGMAWWQCRTSYPQTRSIEMDHWFSAEGWTTVTWKCRDTS